MDCWVSVILLIIFCRNITKNLFENCFFFSSTFQFSRIFINFFSGFKNLPAEVPNKIFHWQSVSRNWSFIVQEFHGSVYYFHQIFFSSNNCKTNSFKISFFKKTKCTCIATFNQFQRSNKNHQQCSLHDDLRETEMKTLKITIFLFLQFINRRTFLLEFFFRML